MLYIFLLLCYNNVRKGGGYMKKIYVYVKILAFESAVRLRGGITRHEESPSFTKQGAG